jgi:hypothetical protein
MKKFTANYLIDDQGNFLKNGIVVTEDDGTLLQYVDTSDNLIEIAGLSFHNGILLADCTFIKQESSFNNYENNSPLSILVLKAVEGLDRFSIQNLIDLAKQIQDKFQGMNITEIMNEIMPILILQAGYKKEYKPGIFLLMGVDLPRLRFTSKTKLKKIL